MIRHCESQFIGMKQSIGYVNILDRLPALSADRLCRLRLLAMTVNEK